MSNHIYLNPTQNSIAPVFSTPNKVILRAINHKTQFAMSDFGNIVSTDAVDGELVAVIDSVDNKPAVFRKNQENVLRLNLTSLY